MYIKTDNKEIGAKLAAHYRAGKPIEIMGKLFLGGSIGFEYPGSCVEFHGSEVSKVAWTGEGLPPVGTVCEMQDGIGVWTKVEIFSVHGGYVHGWDSDKRISYFSNYASEFRPIRTPEQIGAEERENTLNRMVATVSMLDKGWARKVCAGLYDAGYRKKDNAEGGK